MRCGVLVRAEAYRYAPERVGTHWGVPENTPAVKRGECDMLSGVMLIVVTMFAVLGAYYLSDVLTGCLFRRKKAGEALVVLRAETGDRMWAGVLDVRAALPDIPVVVLCAEGETLSPPGAGVRGVALATPETLAEVIAAQLDEQK